MNRPCRAAFRLQLSHRGNVAEDIRLIRCAETLVVLTGSARRSDGVDKSAISASVSNSSCSYAAIYYILRSGGNTARLTWY